MAILSNRCFMIVKGLVVLGVAWEYSLSDILDSYGSKNPNHETMMANRIFVGFSAVFCLFPYDLLVELNEQAEAPFDNTV